MTTATEAPWWATAPNPACSPWCDEDHAPNEFTKGAGLLCQRPVESFAIEVGSDLTIVEIDISQYRSGEDEPGTITTHDPDLWVRIGNSDMSLSFAQAIDLGERLAIAAHKGKAIAEGRA